MADAERRRRGRKHRRAGLRGSALVLLGALALPLAPVGGVPAAHADGQPKYSLEVIAMRANDETGRDWAGSDEVYVYSEDHTGASYGSGRARTRTYGDIDTGENVVIGGSERCLTARVAFRDANRNGNLNAAEGDTWGCASGDGGASYIDETVTLYEEEWGSDERIGTARIFESATSLHSKVPQPGDVSYFTRTFSTSGNYSVSFKITRVN